MENSRCEVGNRTVPCLGASTWIVASILFCLIGSFANLQAHARVSNATTLTTSPFSGSETISKNAEVRIVPDSEYDFGSHNYFSTLLKLALKKTEPEYGERELIEINEHLVQKRALQQLQNDGTIDVYWTVTTKQREQKALPVRVPLLKGIMGYRVGLVRSERLEDFERLNSAVQLKRLIAGQGHDWPDFEILSDNGFEVLGTSVYDSLVDLLYKGRVDYYPRAINETIAEYAYFDSPELAIEPNFILYYPSYIFFFVAKNKPELAKRLELGLDRAMDDGSFEQLFKNYINIYEIKAQLNLDNRQVIKLKNNLLSEETLSIKAPGLIRLSSK